MATIKQIEAAKKLGENGGNISKTMRDVGYEPTTAKNPKKLTESKGWKELVKKIPDSLLLKTQLEGLKATNREKPDFAVRHKYLETGLKLKRYLTNDKEDSSQPVVINIVKFTQHGLDRIEVQTSGLPTSNT